MATALRWVVGFAVAFGLIVVSGVQASASSHDGYVDIDLDGAEAGLWLTKADGTVETRGPAPHFGDRPGLMPGEHVVALAPTPAGDGYWLFTSKGNVFAFGAAVDHGDVGHLALSGDIVSAVATTDGGGYYLIGTDGGIFTLGSAVYHGSIPEVLPGVVLDAPVVAISVTPGGYVLVAGDGGTFAFGAAAFHGSIPQILPGVALNSSIVGLVPGSAGYLMLGGDGGIFNFGISSFHGSLAGVTPDRVVAVAVKGDLSGYLILDQAGNIWPLGDARDIGVATFTGSGNGSVAYDFDDPMIVYVNCECGLVDVSARDGANNVVDQLPFTLGFEQGSYLVHAPTATSLVVESDGAWSVQVRPLSYAEQWRSAETHSNGGTFPGVVRLVGFEAGSRVVLNTSDDTIVTARDRSGSLARVLVATSGANVQQTVAVVPTWTSATLLDVRSVDWSAGYRPLEGPRTVDVTGDSVAITMEINFPNSMAGQLTVRDSAIEGCGVIDEGSMISGGVIRRGFSVCSNFASRWAANVSAHNPEITLVVLGAWEVFDLWHLGVIIPFGSAEHDAVLSSGISEGVDALLATGTEVALMEVPCQYPRPGGGLTPLPERGDFARTAHLNDLLRAEAASHSQVHFITAPPEFCSDPVIGDNPSLRWDGTHYGPAGGAFVWNHIRDQLLGLP